MLIFKFQIFINKIKKYKVDQLINLQNIQIHNKLKIILKVLLTYIIIIILETRKTRKNIISNKYKSFNNSPDYQSEDK